MNGYDYVDAVGEDFLAKPKPVVRWLPQGSGGRGGNQGRREILPASAFQRRADGIARFDKTAVGEAERT